MAPAEFRFGGEPPAIVEIVFDTDGARLLTAGADNPLAVDGPPNGHDVHLLVYRGLLQSQSPSLNPRILDPSDFEAQYQQHQAHKSSEPRVH